MGKVDVGISFKYPKLISWATFALNQPQNLLGVGFCNMDGQVVHLSATSFFSRIVNATLRLMDNLAQHIHHG